MSQAPDTGTVDKESLKKFITDYKAKVERYGLMYGGDLNGIESILHTLWHMEDFAEDGVNIFDEPTTLFDHDFNAYQTIAQKYKCGNWPLSAKVSKEMPEGGKEASDELVRRLNEVYELRKENRKKR